MLTTFAMLLSLTSAPAIETAAMAVPGDEVDVALILAVDVSRSMDTEELEIQRSGYVAALQHPDFIDAVRTGLLGRVAISYYEWSGMVDSDTLIDWQIIETADDAKSLAAKVQAAPMGRYHGTSISGALAFGQNFFEQSEIRAMRRVIDVSGDGPNNRGEPVVPARDAALRAGIVINGLAIMLRPSATAVSLDSYYQDCVVGGPGSFVVPVHKREDFAAAIRRKLVMEISGISPSPKVIKAADKETDCMIGEKLRYQFSDP